jgi:hypothetical protein
MNNLFSVALINLKSFLNCYCYVSQKHLFLCSKSAQSAVIFFFNLWKMSQTHLLIYLFKFKGGVIDISFPWKKLKFFFGRPKNWDNFLPKGRPWTSPKGPFGTECGDLFFFICGRCDRHMFFIFFKFKGDVIDTAFDLFFLNSRKMS